MAGYREMPPPPPASAVVAAFWAYTPGPAASPVLRVLPDGCIDLIARLRVVASDGRVELQSLHVCGPTDRPNLVAVGPDAAWVGVRFRPATAGPVLGVRPPDVFGRLVDATCAPGAAGLAGHLGECSTVGRMLAALADHFAATAPRCVRLDRRTLRAVRLLGDGVCGGVAGVARAVGVSERTIHRDVLAAVGMAPNAFARVQRFQRAVRRLRAVSRPDLSAVATAAGYADQSHMTRDFRVLAGLTPAALRQPTDGIPA